MDSGDPWNAALPIASVVVPAHDEAGVVGECLRTLLADARTGEFELCVVPNGCSDDTAAVARSACAPHPVTVVEVLQASKIEALRRGDEVSTVYPRIYLDADVALSTDAARGLVATLRTAADAAVAAPGIVVDADQAAAAVRAYYRVWIHLPYVTAGVIGAGVFGVNSAGGRRLGTFPDVTNDDGWVRSRFDPAERLTSAGVFTIRAPRTTSAMIRRQARVVAGNEELNAAEPGSARTNSVAAIVAVGRVDGVSGVDVACYLGITVASRVLQAWRRRRGTVGDWSTDTTTRGGVAVS